MSYNTHFNTKQTAQTQEVHGKNQVQNNAGCFVFGLTPIEQLKRFLVLGCEGGSYYASEKAMTVDNATNAIKAIQENGVEAVKLIVNVSENGRAPKNDAAIFALTLAMTFGNEATKKEAYDSIVKVCRTGTHLFTLCDNVQKLRGWSRGLRGGVAKFYNNRKPEQLAMQLIKYRQRNGWTHKDVLRLSHVKAKDTATNELLNYAVGKGIPTISSIVNAFEVAQTLTTSKDDIKTAISLITENNLPWEALPTQLLNEKEIWEALLPTMGITALVRNLGKMTSIGVLGSNLDKNTRIVVSRLTDQNLITESKLHPLAILVALKTYASGKGLKGSLTWGPVSAIKTALNSAFYLAFGNVEATGLNIYVANDGSGSMFMESHATIANTNILAGEAAAALSMLYLEKEKYVEVRTFSSTSGANITRGGTKMTKVLLEKGMPLDTVLIKTQTQGFGATDCALPMLDAIANKLDVDVFIINTDNETYVGDIHPYQALKDYRKKMNKPNAKLIVVGMTATGFTIADPSDKGMLDVVGFDTAAPEIMNMFMKGEI
jgi:60 kDa SS-A/Ro ribonucleoprotein